MAEQDYGSEILELKRQMEALMSRQSAQEEGADTAPESKEPTATKKKAGAELSKLHEKLEEFMGLLEQDLKQVPVTTAVAIFGLGVLFGRLLPR